MKIKKSKWKRKRHERKAPLNSANLPYLLLKSPKRRRNKSRTKWVPDPNEDGAEPERR
jgi:hypothetical protein